MNIMAMITCLVQDYDEDDEGDRWPNSMLTQTFLGDKSRKRGRPAYGRGATAGL